MPTPSRKRPGCAAVIRWCDAATSVAGASTCSRCRWRRRGGWWRRAAPRGGTGRRAGPADPDRPVAERLDLLGQARGELVAAPPDPDAAEFDGHVCANPPAAAGIPVEPGRSESGFRCVYRTERRFRCIRRRGSGRGRGRAHLGSLACSAPPLSPRAPRHCACAPASSWPPTHGCHAPSRTGPRPSSSAAGSPGSAPRWCWPSGGWPSRCWRRRGRWAGGSVPGRTRCPTARTRSSSTASTPSSGTTTRGATCCAASTRSWGSSGRSGVTRCCHAPGRPKTSPGCLRRRP